MTSALNAECVLSVRGGGGPKGECPVWDSRLQMLYWVDIDGHSVHRFDPIAQRDEVCDVGEQIGSFALRLEPGQLLIATRSGLHFLDFASGAKRFLLAPEPNQPLNRMNDGRCDPSGRFWVGSMRDPSSTEDRCGALYRVERDLSCMQMLNGLGTANGLAFSPDAKTMYLSDSNTMVRTIWAFDFDAASGDIRRRRVFADTLGQEGRPDGACCDADGGYWSAHIDGSQVVRYDPTGRVDKIVMLPVKWPSMIAFGGARLDTLYITTIRRGGAAKEWPEQPLAGSLFACVPGVCGLSEPTFGA
ncbi:MAG: SMP-30/gluconolactonase/LRE family protein [Pseudomonadota bacterium]|nr:SMP-30/gluconolactonase/LRE family protein [Pseudomonadota bacterium]